MGSDDPYAVGDCVYAGFDFIVGQHRGVATHVVVRNEVRHDVEEVGMVTLRR